LDGIEAPETRDGIASRICRQKFKISKLVRE